MNKMTSNKENIVFKSVINLIENKQNWSGTMTNLKKKITSNLSKEERAMLPKSPAGLRVVLNKVVNRIRNRKVSVKFSRTNKARLVKFMMNV